MGACTGNYLPLGERSAPQHSLFEGKVSHTWKLSLKQFCFYLTATKKDNKDDKIKVSVLLTCTGQKLREIFKTFTFDSADDKMKLKPVLNKFSEYYNAKKNVTILCHKFFTYRHLGGQSFHDSIVEPKKLSNEC